MDELTNMKEKKKRRMSKKDWVLIVVILCVAGLAFLLHEVIGADGAGSVTVKVNGKIEGVYSLAEDREIKINGGSNVLVIKNHEADMVDANCPDKLCVNQKPVSKNHESIICLPNKIVLKIVDGEEAELDAVTN